MSRASADIPWRRALASVDRDAAIAALEKELASLERRSLTPIPPDHPDRLAAERGATPGRVVLAQKRDGRYKGRGIVRGDKQDKLLVDGAGFVYYAPSSQAAAVRALLFRGKRPANYTIATVDVETAYLQTFPFGDDVPPRYVWFRHPASGEKLFYRQTTPLYGESSHMKFALVIAVARAMPLVRRRTQPHQLLLWRQPHTENSLTEYRQSLCTAYRCLS